MDLIVDTVMGPLPSLWKLDGCYVCGQSLGRVRLCSPLGCSLPGSCVHGIFQARLLEWVAISYSRGSARPRDRTRVSRFSWIAGRFFTHWADREAFTVNAKLCWYDVVTGTVPRTDIHHGIGKSNTQKKMQNMVLDWFQYINEEFQRLISDSAF